MANAYSQPLNYQDTLNISDVARYNGQVQGAMQQKFDINLAKMDELVGKIATIPLAREKDKQYLGERLQKMIQSVDASSKLDLTDSTASGQINSYITGAIDENVKKQLKNSQKITSFDGQVKELVKKDPKLYSDINYAYAKHKAGLDKYLGGETDDLGSLNYTPYVDKTKVLDELKKLKDLKGDKVVEFLDNKGGKVVKTLNGLSEQEIIQYMPGLLSSEVLNQLKMDGWARYKDNMPVAKAEFEKYKSSRTISINGNIEEVTAIKNSTLSTPAEKKEASKKLEYLILEKQSMKESLDSIDIEDPEQVGYFLEKGSYQQSLAKMASGNESTKYEKDDMFFAKAELELAYAKNSREEEKFNFEKEQAEKKASIASGGLGGAEAFVASPMEDPNLEENPDFLAKLTGEHSIAYKDILQGINQAINGDNASEEQKQIFKNVLAREGFGIANGQIGALKGSGDKTKNVSRASAAIKAFTAAKLNVSYPAIAKRLAMSDLKANSLSNTLSEVNSRAYKETFKANSDNYIQQLKNIERSIQPTQKSSVKLTELDSEINSFVKRNGGWANLKTNIEDDKNKIKELADLIEKAPGVGGGLFNKNLREKVNQSGNTFLTEMNQKGGGGYFSTKNEYNVVDLNVKRKIISLMSQSGDSLSGSFDEKDPITVFVDKDGNIQIKQNKSASTKEGVFSAKIAANQKATPGSALYKYLESNISLLDNTNGSNAATNPKTKIKPYVSPNFIPLDNQEILKKSQGAFQSISPQVNKQFLDEPVGYLNTKGTQEIFQRQLAGKFSPEDINKIVSLVEDNIQNFDLTVRPIDGFWGATVTNKMNSTQIANGTFTFATQNLDPDMLDISRNYPQVIIVDQILRLLKNDLNSVNRIFNINN